MKLKIHSIVDLITNSSTVIFTYSEGSLSALEELVNEMLKAFGRTERFDDIFCADVFLEETSAYLEYYENSEEVDSFETVDYDYIERLKQSILIGEVEKPHWMSFAEENDEHWMGYRKSTVIEIQPKNEQYKELASKLLNYLYSTDHEATRNG